MAKKETKDGSKSGYVPVPPIEHRFSPENQPSRESKSKGAKQHWALRKLLELSTGQKFEGSAKEYRKQTALYFEIPEEEVTVSMIMDYRQVEKAILKGDTQAYNAVKNRAFGTPPKEPDEPPIQPEDPNSTSQIDLGGGIIFEI